MLGPGAGGCPYRTGRAHSNVRAGTPARPMITNVMEPTSGAMTFVPLTTAGKISAPERWWLPSLMASHLAGAYSRTAPPAV